MEFTKLAFSFAKLFLKCVLCGLFFSSKEFGVYIVLELNKKGLVMNILKILTPIALGFGLGVNAFAVEDYAWGNVRFDGGGFVSAIMPSPAAEGLIYARTDVGGIYRYEPTTKRWMPLMDFLSENDKGLYGTEAFALDPTDPKKIYVLGGTGYFSDGRTAVFRSSDLVQHSIRLMCNLERMETAWAVRRVKNSR